MKFSKYLNTVSIWNHHCIPYQKLKRKLRLYFSPNSQSPITPTSSASTTTSNISPLSLPTTTINGSSSPSTLSPVSLHLNLNNNQQPKNPKEFLTLLKIEIQKVDQFISDQEKEFYQRFLYLLSRFKAVDFSSPFSSFLYPINQSDPNHQREINTMLAFQAAFEDVIKQLADLDEFAKINRWAIQKLLIAYTKKYAKSESRSRKGSIGESTSNKNSGDKLKMTVRNGDDSNPNSPVVLHNNKDQQQQNQQQSSSDDKFYNENVANLELGNCNNLRKITLEIEREYQFILSSGLNFINNPFINLLSEKEKELSKILTIICQSIINNNFDSLKENIEKINRLMKELNINGNINLMWKEAIHSCICKTIYLGSLEMTEYLFSCYEDIVNINFRDEVDKQFIHIAAEHGHANLLEFILKRGGNIQSRDHLLRTPLHLAASGGHVNAVKLLIDRGAKVDDSDRSKSTPLHLASRSRGETACSVLEILLSCGASLATPAVHGRLPIHEAAAKGLVDNLKLLLRDSDLIDAQDSFGRTPLIEASRYGHKDAVKILLEVGANVDRVDEDRRSCLHEAASSGSLETLELLLSNVRDGGGKEQVTRIVNLQDDDGWTALHEATYQNWVQCTKVLLENFANPYIMDKGEWSPIVHSLYRGNIQSSLTIMDYLKANPSVVMNMEQQSSVPGTPKGLKDSTGSLLKDGVVDQQQSQDSTAVSRSPKTPSVLSKSGAINLSSSLLSILNKEKDGLIEGSSKVSPVSSSASPATNLKNKITKSMISNVTFKIISSVKDGEGYRVGIIGNRKALGKWNPLHALFLEKVETINGASGESIWVGKASVPTNVPIEYKYIICQGSRLDSWETLPENRKFTPEEEVELINDGTFGSIIDPTNGEIINTLTNQTNQQTDLQESLVKEYLNNNNEKFIEKGYLVNDTQVKIRFGNISSTDPQRRIIQPIKMFTSDVQFGRVVVSLCTRQKVGIESNLLAGTDPTQITLPISKDQTITFQTSNIQELSTVQFDLYKRGMSSVLIGRASFLAKELLERNSYVCTCPIMNSTLQTIGELTFFPLVVSPFHHPRISDVLSNVFWKSTLLIGHRGGGAENARAVGRYRRTHIKENTILSFVTAASLGAQYIEFDVQLSREKVPIIYHDFEVATGVGSIKLPLNRLPVSQISEVKKDQFKNQSTSNGSKQQQPLQSLHQQQQQLKKSKSMTDLVTMFESTMMSSFISNVNSPSIQQPSVNNSSSAAFTNPLGIGIVDTMATLEQAFKSVPLSTGFNIEIKYPSVEVEEMLRLNNVNRNEYVDTILTVVFDHAGSRPVIFSSFDPDICLLCSLKQPRYPVFFLSNAGLSQHSDPRCNSIAEAIRFSKSSHLLGIVTNSRILVEGTPIIGEIKTAGLMLCSWGAENNDPQQVDLQETLGVDAVIVDHVAYVSKHYNN